MTTARRGDGQLPDPVTRAMAQMMRELEKVRAAMRKLREHDPRDDAAAERVRVARQDLADALAAERALHKGRADELGKLESREEKLVGVMNAAAPESFSLLYRELDVA